MSFGIILIYMSRLSFPFGHYFPNDGDDQTPSDVAIVMPSIIRRSLYRALDSIFRQDFSGRLQILVGIDRPSDSLESLFKFIEMRPRNHSVLVLHLPFSTAVRNGGLHLPSDGGSLRASLSLIANARYIAFLDDDNAWRSDHISKLYARMSGCAWAFSYRMLVTDDDYSELAIDQWDSVGPNRGRFKSSGGFVDPNCLMIDKVALTSVLSRWADTGTGAPGVIADRHFFDAIKDTPFAEIAEATVLYTIRKSNILHQFMQSKTQF